MYTFIFGILSALFQAAAAQDTSTFKPVRPPAFPLAVKSPYLSAWLPAGSANAGGGYLPGQWPTFWTGQWLGWTGMVRVDNQTFVWMGAPGGVPRAKQISAEYTSTRSTFVIHAGPAQVKVTFLSPLTPNDLMRQSLVFSYMNVEVSLLDDKMHDVQLYTDISAEWASGNIYEKAEWSRGTTSDGISYHKVWKQDQHKFGEHNDQAQWGNVYYATESQQLIHSFQSGEDRGVRYAFANNGHLHNIEDTEFRAINDRWPVFAHAINLGFIGTATVPILFTVGLCQDPAIQFLGKDGLKDVPPLWKSYYKDDLAALSFFHKDYANMAKLSIELDDKIVKDSKAAGGDNYTIITTLSARQAFGTTQLVGTKEKHYLFLKEISSNGNTQTVDVIYPAMPIFLYTNPELLKLLLDPHFENQESGHYPNMSAIHDLGEHYPNATGHPDGKDEKMPVEECGNQLTMVLAYVQHSGNAEYIKSHYKLLKQWVDYLIRDSLIPAWQLSTDDFAGELHNQTNLALKGVIGIEAMARMSAIVGEDNDAKNFSDIAREYIGKWIGYGMNLAADPPHAMLNYNNADTHGLLYNLYNDRLLNLSLVPQSIFDIQSAFYPSVAEPYGLPLDTRHGYTKTDWQIFCAAVAGRDTKKMFIDKVAGFAAETPSNKPWTDLYEAGTGWQANIDFRARPVVGGHFAVLLLDAEGYGAPMRYY